MSFALTRTFFTELRVLSSELSKDCKELRSTVEHPPLRHEASDALYFGSTLIEQIGHKLQNIEEESNQLVKYPGLSTPFSFQHILATCESLYHLNDEWIQTVESGLEQYGYEKNFVASKVEKEVSPTNDELQRKPRFDETMSSTKQAPATPPQAKPAQVHSIATPKLEDYISATTLNMLEKENDPLPSSKALNSSKLKYSSYELSPPSFSEPGSKKYNSKHLSSPPATPLLTPAEISHSSIRKKPIMDTTTITPVVNNSSTTTFANPTPLSTNYYSQHSTISEQNTTKSTYQTTSFDFDEDDTGNFSLLPVSQFVQTPQPGPGEDEETDSTANYLNYSRKSKKVTPDVVSSTNYINNTTTINNLKQSTVVAANATSLQGKMSLLSPSINSLLQPKTVKDSKALPIQPAKVDNNMKKENIATSNTKAECSKTQSGEIVLVTAEEMAQLPGYLKAQVSVEELNNILQSIVNFLKAKNKEGKENREEAVISEVELRDNLNLGAKTRGVLLMLIQLKRFRSIYKNNASCFALM